MAILKHIVSKSSNYGAALEYLIFKHDELRKTPILDQNGNRIMRDEFYLDGLNCEPYSFDAACQQLNREYQKNKNKNEIKSHHYIISFDPRDSTENCLTGKRAQELGLECGAVPFHKRGPAAIYESNFQEKIPRRAFQGIGCLCRIREILPGRK